MEAETGAMWLQAREYCIPRNWKKQGTDFFPVYMEGAQPCWPLNFGPVILILDFWTPELWKRKYVLFLITKFVLICCSSHLEMSILRYSIFSKTDKHN